MGNLLVSLIMIVLVFWVVHGVCDQLLEGSALADELNEFGNASATA